MNTLKKFSKARESGALIFLAILFLIVGIINPAFLEPESLIQCLNDSVVFTLLSVGIAFVILTGEIDVSIGATLGMSAAVAATMLRNGSNVIVVILVSLLIGALIGFLNGLGVAILNIPSLIFTLGMNGVVRGLIYVYTGGAWVENLPQYYKAASSAKIFGHLTYFYFFIILAVVALDYWTKKTIKGRYFITVGDTPQGANLVGIPVGKTKIVSFMLSGVFAAIAGLIYTSRIGFVTPIAGNGYEMKAIAGCVIGGIALTGGQGSLLGASIGAIIMSSISRILVFMGFSSDYDNTITGIMLIAIVVITTVAQNKSLVENRHNVLLARTCGASSGEGDKSDEEKK